MAFESVIAATPLTPNTYAISLSNDWCIGSVPNGGYVASVLLSVARTHATGTLSRLDQPDTMSMQLQYVRRTRAGDGIVTIRDVKLGRAVSVIHLTLSQDGHDEVEGYVTQTNFAKQAGISLPTSFISSGLAPTPPPVDLALLEQRGEDGRWFYDKDPPLSGFRVAMKHVAFYLPKHRLDSSLVEQWVRFRPGGPDHDFAPFTNESLGFVVDMFPLVVEQFSLSTEEKQKTRWYPTVALNLDIKKRLPPEGAKWLYVRVRAGAIREGRMDLQVVVLDTTGELVALSSHVSLVLSADRNLATRSRGEGQGDQIKAGKL